MLCTYNFYVYTIPLLIVTLKYYFSNIICEQINLESHGYFCKQHISTSQCSYLFCSSYNLDTIRFYIYSISKFLQRWELHNYLLRTHQPLLRSGKTSRPLARNTPSGVTCFISIYASSLYKWESATLPWKAFPTLQGTHFGLGFPAFYLSTSFVLNQGSNSNAHRHINKLIRTVIS